MEEFLDFIKEPRFIHRTCLSLHWWPIGWQIFSRNGIYFSARYSCLCCVLWILFGDKGKCRQKILVFLKWKKKLKNEKGDIFISWKNELKKLDFNDWNSSLIAGQDAKWTKVGCVQDLSHYQFNFASERWLCWSIFLVGWITWWYFKVKMADRYFHKLFHGFITTILRSGG